ncbi:plexin domain-containing protein 2 isoform X2 [Pseudomyrmex gracilis]|uniref:plexin domain-containing protein 2 isoform X2 n=1 Tax=Pseudomyrmex gracilis TaxID=219809 RepID=UPI000994D69B|nr:plexin domain-containing protein 2 isoform X2 [Pseudomyrmex gracilis]
MLTERTNELQEHNSFYNYVTLEEKSSLDHQSFDVRLIYGQDVTRNRRAASDQTVVTNEQKNESEHMLMQPQQQQQQQQKVSVATSNTTNVSSLSNSTAYSTSEVLLTSTVHPLETDTAPSVTKPELKKKASSGSSAQKPPDTSTQPTFVKPPLITGEMSTVSVLANQTLYNITGKEHGTNKQVNSEEQNKQATNVGTNQTKVTDTKETDETSGGIAADTEKIDDIGDISISKFSEKFSVSNTTLTQNNITKMVNDTHQYYNSTFMIDADICKKYWVDMDNHPDLRVNNLLSQSHRRAATVKLKFDFPFYGHKVRNITIATGGFLYTGEYVHSWLAATQYIAPLMANFDTRLSNASYVKYADNGTAFTVEWEKVVLQDKPDAGAFTFQVTLHQNGDIVFVYSMIPLMVDSIEDKLHPVKVGLSDAYILDRTVFFVRRKTIYEYHRVHFNQEDIKNCTVIYLKALPTCLNMNNCRDCLMKVPDFDCKWCPALNQCSTGTSRQRQDWVMKRCDAQNIKEPDNCPVEITTFNKDEEYDHHDHLHSPEKAISANEMSAKQEERPGTSPLESTTPNNMGMSVSGIIGILTVIALVVGLAGWGAYAYRNPHSASGQMLIKYRPSQWSWRRGEARYTAATIHM